MSEIFFSHANGFPARTYEVFFHHLQPHTVSYVDVFGLGEYQPGKTWRPMVQELIENVETRSQQRVWGLGHSFGGVLTLWAAIERPDLFKGIIMLDPPIFPWWFRLGMGIVHSLGISEKVIPIAKKASRRREKFDSRNEAYHYWKNKSLFKAFDPEAFDAYINYGLKPSPSGGFELTIPRSLESKLFATTPAKIGNTKPTVPSYYMYATQGVVPVKNIHQQQRIFSKTTFIPFEGQHMFPLEQPEKTAAFIKNIISGHVN
ncbi:MAG: alpha/beta hydrolase [Bacteroidia bacterium]